MREIIADGHEIQSHTYTHSDLVLQNVNLVQELQRVEIWVRDTCQINLGAPHLRVMRPPFGSMNVGLRQLANQQGYSVATWNIDSLDWTASTDQGDVVLSRVTQLVRDQQGLGQESFMMLFHDSKYFPGLYRAVKDLFDASYEFVKVSDCYAACNSAFCASQPGYPIWS